MKIKGNQQVIDILRGRGAILENGHFVLNAGDHSPVYVDKDMVGVNPRDLYNIGYEMAEMFRDKNIRVVVGPQAGGVGLANFVGYNLGKDHVAVIYAEKEGDGFIIRREAHLDILWENQGNILVSEDILTTGGSAKKVVAAVIAAVVQALADTDAGDPVPEIHVGAICNRGGVTADDIEGVTSVQWLMEIDEVEKYPGDDCLLCREGRPISTGRGHGKKFLETQAAEEGGT